jgi:hypothetical protein
VVVPDRSHAGLRSISSYMFCPGAIGGVCGNDEPAALVGISAQAVNVIASTSAASSFTIISILLR